MVERLHRHPEAARDRSQGQARGTVQRDLFLRRVEDLAGRGGTPALAERYRAPLDAGQPDIVGVVAEVEPAANGHLQNVAGRLRADPLPAVAEQVSVEEAHLLVVGAGVLVPVAAQPLVLAR